MNFKHVLQSIFLIVAVCVVADNSKAQCPAGVTYTSYFVPITPPGQATYLLEVFICVWDNMNVEAIGAENWEYAIHPWYVPYEKVVSVIDTRDNSPHSDLPDDAKQHMNNHMEGLFSGCLTIYKPRQADPSVRYNCHGYSLGDTSTWVYEIYPWTQLAWTPQPYIQLADKATHQPSFMSWGHSSAGFDPVIVPPINWLLFLPRGKFGPYGVYAAPDWCINQHYPSSGSPAYWNVD